MPLFSPFLFIHLISKFVSVHFPFQYVTISRLIPIHHSSLSPSVHIIIVSIDFIDFLSFCLVCPSVTFFCFLFIPHSLSIFVPSSVILLNRFLMYPSSSSISLSPFGILPSLFLSKFIHISLYQFIIVFKVFLSLCFLPLYFLHYFLFFVVFSIYLSVYYHLHSSLYVVVIPFRLYLSIRPSRTSAIIYPNS